MQNLASAVNAAGGEVGVALRYDRRAVSHWLTGMRPRQPALQLVLEVLSRRLDRRVTAAEVGFSVPASETGRDAQRQPWQADIAAELSCLGALRPAPGLRQRHGVPAVAYSLADLAVPGWMQATDSIPRPRRLIIGSDRLGAGTVQAAEAMATVMSRTEAALGGGYCRQALASYLAIDLMPKLSAPMHPALRRRLMTVLTQLCYLCAFMCFDDELHASALRYYRLALQLAAENGDPAGYSITLRGMSVQARSLGHLRQAVELAECAIATRPGERTTRAFLFGQLAVAHAADHDRARALGCLGTAERSLERATCAQSLSAMGAYHLSALTYQQGVVQALLGDAKGAVASLGTSLRHRPPEERRSLAITTAYLAELQLDLGLLDEAVGTWHAFVDYYPTLDCARARTSLATLRARVRPYSRNAAARALLDRATSPGWAGAG